MPFPRDFKQFRQALPSSRSTQLFLSHAAQFGGWSLVILAAGSDDIPYRTRLNQGGIALIVIGLFLHPGNVGDGQVPSAQPHVVLDGVAPQRRLVPGMLVDAFGSMENLAWTLRRVGGTGLMARALMPILGPGLWFSWQASGGSLVAYMCDRAWGYARTYRVSRVNATRRQRFGALVTNYLTGNVLDISAEMIRMAAVFLINPGIPADPRWRIFRNSLTPLMVGTLVNQYWATLANADRNMRDAPHWRLPGHAMRIAARHFLRVVLNRDLSSPIPSPTIHLLLINDIVASAPMHRWVASPASAFWSGLHVPTNWEFPFSCPAPTHFPLFHAVRARSSPPLPGLRGMLGPDSGRRIGSTVRRAIIPPMHGGEPMIVRLEPGEQEWELRSPTQFHVPAAARSPFNGGAGLADVLMREFKDGAWQSPAPARMFASGGTRPFRPRAPTPPPGMARRLFLSPHGIDAGVDPFDQMDGKHGMGSGLSFVPLGEVPPFATGSHSPSLSRAHTPSPVSSVSPLPPLLPLDREAAHRRLTESPPVPPLPRRLSLESVVLLRVPSWSSPSQQGSRSEAEPADPPDDAMDGSGSR